MKYGNGKPYMFQEIEDGKEAIKMHTLICLKKIYTFSKNYKAVENQLTILYISTMTEKITTVTEKS